MNPRVRKTDGRVASTVTLSLARLERRPQVSLNRVAYNLHKTISVLVRELAIVEQAITLERQKVR